LKLALYSFRERLPQAILRERIAELNLPSRIHEDTDLWRRFLAERARLKRIGIAAGDDLTAVGRAALDFVGLEDMDFARLLATVIQSHGNKSDIAAVFTVFAAASDIGFDDLMVRQYSLTNTQQLRAVEIIHEDSLGMPALEAYRLVKAHENDVDRLRAALHGSAIDDQICGDIVAFVQAGYRVAFAGMSADAQAEEAASVECSEDDPEVDELPLSIEEDDESDLSEAIRADLSAHSAEHTLGFERSVVSFSDQSELINTYRIFRHFFNTFFAQIRARTLNALEASELRRALEDEASKLQVSDRALTGLNNVFVQLVKHVKVELAREVRTVPVTSHLTDDDRRSLIEGCIRHILFERTGTDDRFDMCLKLFEYVGGERRCDFASAARALDGLGFETDDDQVREMWFLVVREAQSRIQRELEQFVVTESREVLPPITKGLEKEILRVLRIPGYHRELVFTRGDFGLVTTVRDELGKTIELRLDDDNSPLSSARAGKDSVTVLAKLTPSMGTRTVRGDAPGGFEQQEDKGFRVSHITLASH
jgi:hypothetical protein